MITIRYYGQLRDLADKSEETLANTGDGPSEIYEKLRQQYRFPLSQSHVRVAVNDAFAHWDTPLNDGDLLVFIPPVAGG